MTIQRLVPLLGGSAVIIVAVFLACALIWEAATDNTRIVIRIFMVAVAIVSVLAVAGLCVRYGLTGVWA